MDFFDTQAMASFLPQTLGKSLNEIVAKYYRRFNGIKTFANTFLNARFLYLRREF